MRDLEPDDLVFPRFTKYGGASITQGGMSLRDYFAGQVLVGYAQAKMGPSLDDKDEQTVIKHMVAISYEIADAMLEARKR